MASVSGGKLPLFSAPLGGDYSNSVSKLLWNNRKLAAAVALLACGATPAAQFQWEHAGSRPRSAILAVSPGGRAGFSLVGVESSGVTFTNRLAEQRVYSNHNLMNGSGVALGDFDGDGRCDIYLCNLDGDNILYRNLGSWKFQDVTAAAGVACSNQSATGAVFADLNGDGRLDLLVTSLGGPNSCFINQGGGKFIDTAASAGITSRLGAMSMALGDVDGNGTLDLYIANYGATSILRSGGALNVSYVNGKPVVRGRYAQRIQIIGSMMFELGEPDALYLNDGTGKFKAVSWTDGTFLDENGQPLREAPWDQGLSVMFRDINGDRAPDIYVCNDAFTPDRFWMNDGRGRFRALQHLAWRSTSRFSMGVDFADFDRDGDDDFFVLDMLSREHRYIVTQKGSMPAQPRPPGDLLTQPQMRRNTLFQNRGDGTFAEIANLAGVAAAEWSWNPAFIDVDLDGWEDLLVSNGFPFNMDDMDSKEKVRAMGQLSVEQSRRTLQIFPKLDTRNLAFRNNHDLTFAEVGGPWGFDSKEVSNGYALGDLDNDGDLDVVVNTLNGPALLYRNESSEPRVAIRLKGKAPNTQGIGARILMHGGPVEQSQEMISGGRYVSGDDAMRVFACGNSATRLRAEVIWRNGSRSLVEGLAANRIYEIDEAGAQAANTVAAANDSATPLFTDASGELKHTHHETEFNDFEKQPSLPHRLSQGGPGLSWFDLDGNGWDDLIAGAGRGGQLSVFFNEHGHFTEIKAPGAAPDDLSTILAWRKATNIAELIVGVSNFETGGTNQLLFFEVRGTNIQQKASRPVPAAVGPLALTELHGTMALFVGGRFIPGRYPEAAPSQLLLFREGNWVEDTRNKGLLSRLGSATGVVWTDLNGDGSPELVVSCDWGTIRIFEYANESLVERSKEWGIAELVGRWQSVAAGDLDADGRMDLIAANWGLNSFYNQAEDRQVEMHFGDYNNSGRVAMIEAYRDSSGKIVPWRDKTALETSLPWLAQSFPTHHAFAAASVADIIGQRPSTAVRTRTLASTLFLNRGGKFESIPLPMEAQYTPIFGLAVADFDLDGFQDAALAQNFFAGREHDGPLDAGRGLLLRGSAGGQLKALPAAESGLIAYGEQRGCAVADYDQDGRLDLVFGQNGTETKLFHNSGKAEGLRVRLKGAAPNLNGVGAHLRIANGPAIEFQAGGGNWSQNSSVAVIPTSSAMEVRWPGGKVAKYTIPADSKEIELREDGRILRVR